MPALTDYYRTLSITRASSADEIKRAYRRLALKYHPIRHSDNDSKIYFERISEAYDILGDSKKRAIYDQHGKQGLIQGVPAGFETEEFPGGYKFSLKQAEDLFLKFFGASNPFDELYAPTNGSVPIHPNPPIPNGKNTELETKGNNDNYLLAGDKESEDDKKELNVSLEELYQGTIKRVSYERKIFNNDGSFQPETKTINVEIKKGLKNGTKIIFPRSGNKQVDGSISDLTFIVKEEVHPKFKRNGDDLVYDLSIPLEQALLGSTIQVPTLDGRILHVPMNEVVIPNYKKKIPNEGMPRGKVQEKGDLILSFFVQFPSYVSETQKKLLKKAFSSK